MNMIKGKVRFILALVLITSLLFVSTSTAVIALPASTDRVKVIIAFDRQPGAQEKSLVHAAGGSINHTYHLVPAIAASLPQAAIDALQKNPQVVRIEPDVEVHAIGETIPWGITQIGADIVQASGNTGNGIKVAVIDSGVDYTHPDLADNYAGGYDFVNNDADPMDDNNHGTHVAGTIAAAVNGLGVVGVAPKVSLYAVKVLNRRGSGDFSDVIAALEWCVDNGIQVTNNSFGSSGDPGISVQQAYDAAYAAGVLSIAAAGNEGTSDVTEDTVGYPAKYDSVVAVAATDINDARASFSSTGPAVELSAPGVSIYSTVRKSAYATYSGTSMASPHVAGVAALVIAAGTGTTPETVRTQLQNTADDLGADGKDPVFGFGLVNAVAATEGGTIDPGNNPPVVAITSPTGGASFESGATISFSAIATDDEDGDLSGSITWTSSIDGAIGNGGNVEVILSAGQHTITASVTDSEGSSGSASIEITVIGSELLPIVVTRLEGIPTKINPATWRATVVVGINPSLIGAVITGTWSNGTTVSGTTIEGGLCTFQITLNKKVLSTTFTIMDISYTGHTYVPSEDVALTEVTIGKPD